jgi:hypothetical protein
MKLKNKKLKTKNYENNTFNTRPMLKQPYRIFAGFGFLQRRKWQIWIQGQGR